MARIGTTVAAIGAVLLLLVLGNMIFAIFGVSQTCPANGMPPPATAGATSLYSPHKTFGVNDRLCVAWKPKAYFADELALKTALANAKTAEDATTARIAATPAEKLTLEPVLKLQQTARAAAQTKVDAIPKTSKIVLFIEDTPTQISFDTRVPELADKDTWLWQRLPVHAEEKHNTDTGKAWRQFLSGVGRDGSREVKIGFGDEGAKLPRKAIEWDKDLKISAFELPWLLTAVAGFLCVVVGLIIKGWRTRMLRVRQAKPYAPGTPKKDRDQPPFSLARVQMVWWFSLSLAGFLFIWLTTGQWAGVMTGAVVGLLGISGVSGLAAIAIDGAPATQSINADLNTVQSRGFFFDILGDGDSIALQRVQMFAWTVVLGLIFAWTVVWQYSFPEFDPTLLALAGIINGVYVGFKFPENKNPTPKTPATGAGGASTITSGVGPDTTT